MRAIAWSKYRAQLPGRQERPESLYCAQAMYRIIAITQWATYVNARSVDKVSLPGYLDGHSLDHLFTYNPAF